MLNIYSAKHLDENSLHLNRYGTIEFAKNFKNFLYRLNWQDLDNSEGFDQYEASFPNFVRNALHSDHNENLNENGSEESILFFEYNNRNLIDTVFTRVSARGAHLIFGFQRGALIRGRRSFKKSSTQQYYINFSLQE